MFKTKLPRRSELVETHFGDTNDGVKKFAVEREPLVMVSMAMILASKVENWRYAVELIPGVLRFQYHFSQINRITICAGRLACVHGFLGSTLISGPIFGCALKRDDDKFNAEIGNRIAIKDMLKIGRAYRIQEATMENLFNMPDGRFLASYMHPLICKKYYGKGAVNWRSIAKSIYADIRFWMYTENKLDERSVAQ